jgi:hypothetical protein
MNKNIIIKIGNDLLEKVTQNIALAFKKLGDIYGEYDQYELQNKPLQLIESNAYVKPTANFDNLIRLNAGNFSQQKEEFMQKIKEMKNARIRNDGRYEWRKMINGVLHHIIESEAKTFIDKVSRYKKRLKKNSNAGKIIKPKESLVLIDRIKIYYTRNIESQVNNGSIKYTSALRYKFAINMLTTLSKDINTYTKDEIIDFFNGVKTHRNGAYCFFLLKRVFADEQEKGNIKVNPIATLKNPFPLKKCVTKGSWINLQGQTLIRQNITNSLVGKEVLFYLVTGSRLKEAYKTKIDFVKQIAHIKRDKTEKYGATQTAIPLSKAFCDLIKNDWENMFKCSAGYVGQQIPAFLKSLGIFDKSTHDLRHTFSSNLYYLGVDPKKHQYLMGHSSIQQTYDTYTTLDMSVTKQDIISIWGEFYPIF